MSDQKSPSTMKLPKKTMAVLNAIENPPRGVTVTPPPYITIREAPRRSEAHGYTPDEHLDYCGRYNHFDQPVIGQPIMLGFVCTSMWRNYEIYKYEYYMFARVKSAGAWRTFETNDVLIKEGRDRDMRVYRIVTQYWHTADKLVGQEFATRKAAEAALRGDKMEADS